MILFTLSALAQQPVDGLTNPTMDEAPGDEELLSRPNRSVRPPVQDPTPLDLDDLASYEMGPGLTGVHVQIPRVRDVRVVVRSWRGVVDLPEPPNSEGAMAGSVWTWGSERYDSDAISEMGDLLDLSINSSVDDHSVTLTLEVPKDELAKGLDLMGDVYSNPTFPKKELKRIQEQYARYYDSTGPNSPSNVAQAALSYGWFSADHPYGTRPDPERYDSLKSKDLFAVHEQLTSQGPVTITVIGDVTWAEVEPMLKKHFSNIGRPGSRAELIDQEQPDGFRVIAVDMPKSEQALIRLRMPAPTRDSDARVPMDAIGFALGGHFLSRLNKNLREDKGWTYGTRAGYGANDSAGTFSVSVDVPVDKFAPAVGEIEKEIAMVASDGVTADEIEAFWRGELMEFNSTRGTVGDAAGLYGSLQYHEEDIADRKAWLEAIGAVEPGATKAVAAEVFDSSAPRVWVVVGPKEALAPGFEALGWTPEWVSAEQAIVGDLVGGRL